jgi:hypothetical protein
MMTHAYPPSLGPGCAKAKAGEPTQGLVLIGINCSMNCLMLILNKTDHLKCVKRLKRAEYSSYKRLIKIEE